MTDAISRINRDAHYISNEELGAAIERTLEAREHSTDIPPEHIAVPRSPWNTNEIIEHAAGPGASERPATQAAVVDALALPKAFREIEHARLGDADASVEASLRSDHVGHNDLQRSADLGTDVARQMFGVGMKKDDFLAMNPTVAKRCKEDVAFREGFEAACWAKGIEKQEKAAHEPSTFHQLTDAATKRLDTDHVARYQQVRAGGEDAERVKDTATGARCR